MKFHPYLWAALILNEKSFYNTMKIKFHFNSPGPPQLGDERANEQKRTTPMLQRALRLEKGFPRTQEGNLLHMAW